MTKNRLEAFSDGVFAVAITLLVLDLRVAGPGHGSLSRQLGDEWPSFAAYVVSFLVIGIIWVNHHTLMARFATIDRTLLFLNLLLLMFVTVIPFPTSLFAEYLRAGGRDSHVAAAVYGIVMEGMSLSFTAIFWRGGTHPELLRERITHAQHRAAMRSFSSGSIIYLFTIALAFVSAPATLAAHFAIGVFYIFDRTAAPLPNEPDDPSREAN